MLHIPEIFQTHKHGVNMVTLSHVGLVAALCQCFRVSEAESSGFLSSVLNKSYNCIFFDEL